MPQLLQPKLSHSPTLDTVRMVEDAIMEAKEVISLAELKRRLPRKVNHNTLKVILVYLQRSGKIEFTPYGIAWILMQDISAILKSSTHDKLKKTSDPNKTTLTKEEIVHKIEENRLYLRSLGVKKLTLIGSYAREEATDKSDIDFLVEFEIGRGLYDDYMRLLHFLQDVFDKEIDLAEASLLRDELKSDILEGARVEAQI